MDYSRVLEKKEDFLLDELFLEIWYDSDFLNNRDAAITFLNAYLDLMKKQIGPYSLSWLYSVIDSKVFYCKDKNNFIYSMIVIKYDNSTKTGKILLSFTDPSYRLKGLNRKLFTYVEKYFKSKGVLSFSAMIHSNNKGTIASSVKKGMFINFIEVSKIIE